MWRKNPLAYGWLWLGWAGLLLGCGNVLGAVRSVQEAKATVEALVTEAPATLEAVATTVATAAAAPAVTPADEAPDVGDLALIDPLAADAVRAYRLRWQQVFVLEDTNETHELVTLEGAVNKGQNAQQFWMRDANKQEIEWIQIGNQFWVRVPGQGWSAMAADAVQEMTPVDPHDVWMPVVDVSGWEFVGDETVEGIRTQHYRASFPTALWESETGEFLAGWGMDADYTLRAAGPAQGDVWITPEQWVVKYDVLFPVIAVDNQGVEHPARLEWHYQVWDVNGDVQIQPPDEAATLAESPLPLPPKARFTAAQPNMGMWLYSVEGMSLAEVMDFYRQQAEAGALQLEGETGGMEMGFWQVTVILPDGARYQLMAAPQGNTVALTIQKR